MLRMNDMFVRNVFHDKRRDTHSELWKWDLFSMFNISYFYISTSRSMCAVPKMTVFCNFVISFFPACCSGRLWMILRWFHLSQVLLISLLFLRSTSSLILLKVLYILESSRLLSSSHFCLLKLQHLLTYMSSFHYHALWCPGLIVRDGSIGLHLLIP